MKSHVGRILAKLHLRDRTQAAVFAYETGLVHTRPDDLLRNPLMTRVLFAMPKILIALVASLLAFLAEALVLGRRIPAIPKAGIIGPVLTGQYPLHVALIGLAGLLLGLLAYGGWGCGGGAAC